MRRLQLRFDFRSSSTRFLGGTKSWLMANVVTLTSRSRLRTFDVKMAPFLLRDADMHSAYFATATWLAGWVADVCHSRYCSKTTKPILKLFNRLIAPSFKLLRPLAPIPNSQGNHSSGALNTRGVGKIGDFRRISPFISEMVRDGPMVTMER